MTGGRLTLFVPLLACLALARVLAGPEPEARAAPQTGTSAAAPSTCSGNDCGCVHVELEADCCCASPGPSAPVTRAASVAQVRWSAESSLALQRELPATTLVPAHCGGARRTRAVHGAAPVALSTARTLPQRAAPRAWFAEDEPGPLFDLDREPPTPPPRRADRA